MQKTVKASYNLKKAIAVSFAHMGQILVRLFKKIIFVANDKT